MIGFQYLYVRPHQADLQGQNVAQKVAQQNNSATPAEVTQPPRDRAEVLHESPRLSLTTPELIGSINLKGARIDDVSLAQYHETEDKSSPLIVLLSPASSAAPNRAYYAEFSWLADNVAIAVPNSETVWQTQSKGLSPDHPVQLTWDNGQGLKFQRTIAVDEQAMFTITDSVIDGGTAAVNLYPFGTVARQGAPQTVGSSIVLEGGLGVLGGTLEEYKYKKMVDDKKATLESKGGWLGITDKYWLVAMVPSQDENITGDFIFNRAGGATNADGYFQSDFRGAPVAIAAGGSVTHVTRLFVGAKKVKLLDAYAEKYNIPHFDKAIDFGWFYFLTRPFLYLLTALANTVGSIGLAILLFTVLLKLATLPLSLKSYHSMSRMKTLQPEMKKLQERFAEDKVRLSQEMMDLYKREKVSPVSGCGPTLIQIPIFFALYKVLYVNIEMRQAPFYGWIQDMSAPDPTSVLNLFGLIPLDLPMALHIGAWPILMGISMFMQQKLSPQPPDKSQARLLMFMPILFTYMLARMPAGLVIYWTWSNLLGITQQWYIMKRDEKRKAGLAS